MIFDKKNIIGQKIKLMQIEQSLRKQNEIRVICKNCKSEYHQSLENKFIYKDNNGNKYFNCPYCGQRINF